MPKIAYETYTVVERHECAYCEYDCDYEGVGYRRAGQVDIWRCPQHGYYYIVRGPLEYRGYQVR